MAIDRADWHYGGDYPAGLPPENGGTHIGIYLAWIIMNGLEGDLHREHSAESLMSVRGRSMTGREFLEQECDEKFTEESLSEEGSAFTAAYYSGEGGKGYGPFMDDYEAALVGNLPSAYHVADTWENYDRFAPYASAAYSRWKERGQL
ncbi:MAG: hypothetical protein JST22_20265 [Bacteroidetes bacterium]|nr:hypothetical protein [Bacteroidota bacterium]